MLMGDEMDVWRDCLDDDDMMISLSLFASFRCIIPVLYPFRQAVSSPVQVYVASCLRLPLVSCSHPSNVRPYGPALTVKGCGPVLALFRHVPPRHSTRSSGPRSLLVSTSSVTLKSPGQIQDHLSHESRYIHMPTM